MEKMKKINEVFVITNGIFSNMDFDFSPCEKIELDLLFHSNYGERRIAPLIKNIINENKVASEENVKMISNILLHLFSNKWLRLKKTLELDYEMIHNYYDEFTEEISDTGSERSIISKNKEGNNTGNIEKTGNDTLTNSTDNTINNEVVNTSTKNITGENTVNATEEIGNEKTITENTNDSIFGFNSENSSNSDSSDSNSTENQTGNKTSSITNNNSNVENVTNNQTNRTSEIQSGSSNKEYTNTEQINSTHTETENASNDVTSNMKRIRKSIHKGNIGNLTSQQLIKQEIEVRRNNFIEIVLNDVKEYITIPMYL